MVLNMQSCRSTGFSFLVVSLLVSCLLAITSAISAMSWEKAKVPKNQRLVEPNCSQDVRTAFKFDKRIRHYFVHVPPTYDGKAPLPLVVVLHGGGGNWLTISKTTGMSPKADKEGFLVLYPEGTGLLPTRYLVWNGGDCCGYARAKHIRDVQFIENVVDRVCTDYKVDKSRLYLVGMSNGGMMAYQVACDPYNKFAALAIVSGSMTGKEKKPGREMPVIIFHGTADRHVPYGGGKGKLAKWGYPVNKMPVDYAVKFWLENNNCNIAAVKHTDTRDLCIHEYDPQERAVVFYRLSGADHHSPGSIEYKSVTQVQPDLNAMDIIWEFFRKYRLSTKNGAQSCAVSI